MTPSLAQFARTLSRARAGGGDMLLADQPWGARLHEAVLQLNYQRRVVTFSCHVHLYELT